MRSKLAVSTLLAAALAGAWAPRAQANAPVTTITLLGAETTSTFAPVIQAFERQYPAIKVKCA